MEITQEEMKQNIFDWAKDVSVAIESFARGISETEADLQEAKSSAKKLIEKIDEYLESLKPEFMVGDYVTDDLENDPFVCKVEKIEDGDVHGNWYVINNEYFDASFSSPVKDCRHATPEEIAEYEVALTFHKHGRKPFEVRIGDILRYGESNGKNFLVKGDTIFLRKQDFIDGKLFFLKTAEEVNEWLENK